MNCEIFMPLKFVKSGITATSIFLIGDRHTIVSYKFLSLKNEMGRDHRSRKFKEDFVGIY